MDPLVCIACGTTHGALATRCPCGGALDHTGEPPVVTRDDLRAPVRGVWRHAALFDVPEGAAVSLGEGDTALLEDRVLGAHLKLEHTQPTGSFKDRGATVVVSRAKALGAQHVVEDSSGNAGTAIAAYAARAGLSCTIFAPAFVTPAKKAQIEALGATVEVVPGPRGGVTDAAVKAASAQGAYYASHAYLPHFLDGCATLAYELVRDLGHAPDVVVAPCAMGSVLLGAHRGFDALVRGGVLDQAPRLVAVQTAGFDPLVRAVDGETAAGENRLPDGLLIPEPPRLDQLVDALAACGGTALSVDEDETRTALARLHRRGVLVEPSSAVALAGLERVRAAGELAQDDEVVLVMTGRYKPG